MAVESGRLEPSGEVGKLAEPACASRPPSLVTGLSRGELPAPSGKCDGAVYLKEVIFLERPWKYTHRLREKRQFYCKPARDTRSVSQRFSPLCSSALRSVTIVICGSLVAYK